MPEPTPPSAAPSSRTFMCPGCEKRSPVDPKVADPAREIVRCDACGARIAYGVLMPRVVVTPHPEDGRFVTVLTQTKAGNVSITLDKDLWGQVAHNVISVCPRGRR